MMMEGEEMDSDEEYELERAALGLGPSTEAGTSSKEGGEEEQPKKEYVYNVEAMHERLEDISRVESLPWTETLVCTSSDRAVAEAALVHNDIERELVFYNQAFAAVTESAERFDEAGTKWRRPADYFAEMVKSDKHMKRVKDKLLYEKKLGEEQEERRKQREAKKYAKQVQAEKLKERAQAKNKQIDNLKEWRKQREKNDYSELDKEDYEEAMANAFKKPKQLAGTRIFSGTKKSKARQARDNKFGFGGRKKIQKQNDAKSAADDSGWSQGRFGKYAPGKGKGKKKKGSAGVRPGKARRQQMRNGGK